MRLLQTILAASLLAPVVALGAVPKLAPPATGRTAPNDAALVIGVDKYDALPRAQFAERGIYPLESFR